MLGRSLLGSRILARRRLAERGCHREPHTETEHPTVPKNHVCSSATRHGLVCHSEQPDAKRE
jgi:hypothetical protein